MPWIVGGAILGGALLGGVASNKAASTQAQASQQATQVQQNALDQQVALNKPFYDIGVGAANRLSSQTPYTPSAFNYQADPGYAFRFNEGMKGLNASAAARGGLISGNALQAATNYGQQAGSQEYSNAYNRYLQNNAQNLQAYNTNTANTQYLANMGQSSANNQANAIGQFGNNAASNVIGAGNATAAGMVGGANAISSGVGTGLNYYQNQNMLNALKGSAYNNPYSGMGISGNDASGYTYTNPSSVGPF
jgi:hypothetical protein